MENEGYLIVLKSEVNLAQFESSQHIKNWQTKNRNEYDAYRRAFGKFDIKRYRGISREPLESYLSLDEQELESFRRRGVDVDSNKAARIKLTNIVSETTPDFCDDSFIRDYDDALEIYNLLDNSLEWEIIHIRQNQFEKNRNTLGFDVGYWGSDHFSLIADTIVTPSWHPVADQDYAEVAENLSILNCHLLFDKYSQVIQYKEYYKTKDWAETEDVDGEFCIIQVDAVNVI